MMVKLSIVTRILLQYDQRRTCAAHNFEINEYYEFGSP